MEYISEEERKKKKKNLTIKLSLSIIISLALFASLYHKFKMFGLLESFYTSFGIFPTVLSAIIIFLIMFGLLFSLFSAAAKKGKEDGEKVKVDYEKKEKEEKPKISREITNLIISAIMTGFLIYSEIVNVGNGNLKWLSILLTFGITYTFCEIFSYTPKWALKNIAMWGGNFVIKVAIPSMFLIIILLGAINGRYYPDSIFTSEVSKSIFNVTETMSGIFYEAFYDKLFLQLYNLGFTRPDLWIYLSTAAILILILNSFLNIFKKPKEIEDEEKTPEQLIKEVMEEEEIKRLKEEGKLKKTTVDKIEEWFDKTMVGKKEKAKMALEKEEEEKCYQMARANKDIISIKEMKGGKN